ncbi:MAG: hypothetical protein ACREA9_20595 [Pyrinomonadaceae bacterium]
MWRKFLTIAALLAFLATNMAQTGSRMNSASKLPTGYWPLETILPNESQLARRYGRTILLRANIMRDQSIFQATSGTLTAAVGAEQANDLTSDGNFYRTLWHEVGHYLGRGSNKGRPRSR